MPDRKEKLKEALAHYQKSYNRASKRRDLRMMENATLNIDRVNNKLRELKKDK